MIELLLRQIPCDMKYNNNYISCNSDIEVLALGSSMENDAINPSLFHHKAFNSAAPGQGTEFNYLLYKSLHSQLDSLKAIIFPLSFYSIHDKPLDRKGRSYNTTVANVYYGLKVSIDLQQHILLSIHPFKDVCVELFKFFTKKNYSNIHSDSLGFNRCHNRYSDYSTDIKRGSVVCNGDFLERYYGDDTASNMRMFRNLIEQCARDSVLVLLISTPLTHDFLEYIDKSKVECVKRTGNMLEQQYPNVTYVDLYYDERFRDEDFDDANHLNYRGAEKVSFLLDSIIVERLNRR